MCKEGQSLKVIPYGRPQPSEEERELQIGSENNFFEWDISLVSAPMPPMLRLAGPQQTGVGPVLMSSSFLKQPKATPGVN